MGFVFPQNFNSPYRATSFRDFWRRWHMTLSRFLRDFLYIPLGGSRGGNWKTARNLMITMVLGGLWHGAAWGFVLWGTLHGAGLVIERFLRGRIDAPAWLRWAIVFNLVVFGWVLFRAETLELALTFYAQLAQPGPATLWAPVTVATVVGVIGFQLLPPAPLERLRLRVAELPSYALGFGLAAVVALVGATVPEPGRSALHLLPVLMADELTTQSVPEPPRGPRRRARDALVVVFLSVVVLVLFEGSSVRQAGDDLRPGFQRDVVRTVGEPAGWVADRLPFDEWGDEALAFLEDEGAGAGAGFDEGRRSDSGAVPAVSPDSFDPAELGAEPEPPRALDKLLVTGDSLAMPLDVEMARRLAESDDGIDVERDPHVGTGISKTGTGRLGQAVERARIRTPARRHRGLHRSQRGFRDARSGRRGARVLRPGPGPRSSPTGSGA